MTTQIFEYWDWQKDIGVNPIAEGQPAPPVHATAHYDHEGKLFRVEVLSSPTGRRGLLVGEEPDVSVYDYFCDSSGRILQKRSLGDTGEVTLIVDFEYGADRTVKETAWSPNGGPPKSIVRAVYRTSESTPH